MKEVIRIEREFHIQSQWFDLFLGNDLSAKNINAPLLPLLPTALPELEDRENVEKWLGDAENCLEIRKQWLKFLQQGKVLLELLPERLALEIVQKMETRAFVRAQRSTKWLNELIKISRKNFMKDVFLPYLPFYLNPLKEMNELEKFRESIAKRDGFRFSEIHIGALMEGLYLEEMVKCFEGRRIYTDELFFCGYDFPVELSAIFRQKKMILFYCRTEMDQFTFPKEMKELGMRYYRGDFATAINVLGNQAFRVNWELHHVKQDQLTTIVNEYIQVLKRNKKPGNIFFDLGAFCKFDITILFVGGKESQAISCYTFCTEKESGRICKYNIRMEKLTSGLVGLICYWEEGQEVTASLHCNHYTSMDNFLKDYSKYIGKYLKMEGEDPNLKGIGELF